MFKEILMQWIGEIKEDRISLGLGYFGAILITILLWKGVLKIT